jgi:hypothetical protein
MKHLNEPTIAILLGAAAILAWYFVSSKYRPRVQTDTYRVISAPKDVLVSIPNEPAVGDEDSVVVIIGGMYGSGPRWMIDQVPQEVLDNRYVIMGEYYHSVDETLDIGMQAIRDNGGGEGPKRISSISGFSAGGSQLMNSYSPYKFERVFLIDPASTTAQSMKDYEGEVVFLYGWDVHEDVYGKEYSEIIPEVKEAGGVVENIDMNHYKFPKYTFSKYQNQL